MASATPSPAISLEIRRMIRAPRDTVFQAWIDPVQLGAWFCHARPNYTGRVTELNPYPGGTYRLEVHDGAILYVLRGTYREIKPPEKLVFTWFWETQPQIGETLVTVEFFDRKGATEVVLRHEGFPDAASREAHNSGWVPCFDTLEKFLHS